MAQATPAECGDVELDPERQQDILRLEAALDQMNHFEVLGLSSGASVAEAKKAYHEACLRYHPDRYFKRQIGSFRPRLERIFKRLTEASNVLTDPERRRDYERLHPELFRPPPAPTPEPAPAVAPTSTHEAPPREPLSAEQIARAAERRERLSRHPYLAKTARFAQLMARGKAHLEKGEYAKANNDLQMASTVNSERQVEAKALLEEARRKDQLSRAQKDAARGDELEKEGDLRAAASSYATASELNPKNAAYAAKAASLLKRIGQDLHRARHFAHRAAGLEPANLSYRLALAEILVAMDLKKAAKIEFEEILKRDPHNEEAKRLLKKLRWPF